MKPETKTIDAEDVDDVIAIAAERSEAEREKLSVEEVQQIAEQVSVPAALVGPAIDELDLRRAEGRRAETDRRMRRHRWFARFRNVALLLAAVGIVSSSLGAILREGILSDLRQAWTPVEQQASQVENVIDRRDRVRVQWVPAPDGVDRDAELAGADNRVALERQRYDEAAAAYNSEVSEWPAQWFCGPRRAPCRAALSSEIDRW